MSPAYPKYYKGGRKCKWSLKVDPGQRIQVRLLDVNLRDEMRTSRERGRGERRECSTDSIRVSEKGKNLLRMCGEMKNDILLLSHGNQLEVSFMICSLMIYHLFFYDISPQNKAKCSVLYLFQLIHIKSYLLMMTKKNEIDNLMKMDKNKIDGPLD